MWLNLVHSFRHLRRRPVVAALGIASLAVGIGCALACASVVNTVLFRALPYAEPDRLVIVWENNARRGVGLTPASIPNYEDLKAAATTLEHLGAFTDVPLSLDGPDGSVRIDGYQATAGVIDQTGVAPLLGRLFTPAEDRAGSSDVVVLSHGLWQRQFGGDPTIVGRVIQLSGVPHTVIGVMPRSFQLPPIFGVRLVGLDTVFKNADLWIPFKIDGLPKVRPARSLYMLGRLKAGRSAEESQAEASTVARRLATDYPVDDFGLDFSVVPLETQVITSIRTLLLLLLVVGVMVLAIAATNAAHLLLADSLTMTGETAMRSALGASPWRLASQQGTLSIVWCTLATAGALLVAVAIQAPVAAYTKANVPRLNDVSVDGTVGVLAITVGLVLAFAISALPIAYAGKAGTIRTASAVAAPTGMSRWRRIFVVLQLAVAIVVLSTAALLFRSAGSLARVNPGFVAEGVSAFELMLPESRYPTPASRVAFQRRLLELVADVPGSVAAATVDYLPFSESTSVVNFTVEHHVPADAMAKPRGALRAVSAAYFNALSIPSMDGRGFEAADEAADAKVAIVTEAFVRRYVPDGRAIGRRIKRGDATSSRPWMTIVGVVGSVRGAGLAADPQPEVFVPYVKDGTRSTLHLIVKAPMPASALAAVVGDRIRRVDAALFATEVTDMTELIARAVGQPYFYARLFGVMAGVAFMLSLAGIYSVAVLGVSARSSEIAIRSCLGAQRSDIVRLILGETALSVAAAIAIGSFGAVILQKRVAAFVYGVGSTDWMVIAASALLLSVVALGTVYIAIRRGSSGQPLDLLKHGAGALA
jgi:putative ABC transport system permease protein